jgi:hypothetical protein
MVANRDCYAHVEADAAACVQLPPGGIGLRWYELGDCVAMPVDAADPAP